MPDAKYEGPTIWIATVTHRSGVNIYAATTEELAYEEVYGYVALEWDTEVPTSMETMPEDHREAVEMYFELVDTEFYDIGTATVRSG